MATFYFSIDLDERRTLCLAPLTNRKLALSGQEIVDTSGYFLFERRNIGESEEIEILAQALSEEAAIRLKDMLHLS